MFRGVIDQKSRPLLQQVAQLAVQDGQQGRGVFCEDPLIRLLRRGLLPLQHADLFKRFVLQPEDFIIVFFQLGE